MTPWCKPVPPGIGPLEASTARQAADTAADASAASSFRRKRFYYMVLDEAHNDVGPDKEPLGMVVVRGNSVQAMEALELIPKAKGTA